MWPPAETGSARPGSTARAQDRPVTLVTGATDGIGLALAERVVRRGELVLRHGRKPAEEAHSEGWAPETYLRADLSQADGPLQIARRLNELGVDSLARLVLNAGTGSIHRPSEEGAESVRRVLDVNLWSSIELVHHLLPKLRRGRGRIVLISSVLSALPMPRYATYAASKAGLEGFARSLRAELGSSPEVQVLRLGAVRTGLHAKIGLAEELDTSRFPSAERVAVQLESALDGPPRWQTIGLGNRLVRAFARTMPRLMERLQARR